MPSSPHLAEASRISWERHPDKRSHTLKGRRTVRYQGAQRAIDRMADRSADSALTGAQLHQLADRLRAHAVEAEVAERGAEE